jgi:cobalamin biosynthetic protein CobC
VPQHPKDGVWISNGRFKGGGDKGETGGHGFLLGALPITEAVVLKPIVHGGDLGEVMRRFPDAPTPWLDLSTGINPRPFPVGALPDVAWTRLPSHDANRALLATAMKRYGVRDEGMIVAAPGTQALIQLLPRLVPKSRVAVLGPTYEEHEACWARQGHEVCVVDDVANARDAEVVIAVSPDNPTGRLLKNVVSPSRLLVVDEAFVDFLPPGASLAANLPPRTVVLRSFGKTYGLAGLRLGFAIAEPQMIAHLGAELGPWAVSGPALEIGRRALADDDWLAAAKARLERNGTRLDELLAKAGFGPIGATPLFRLVHHDDVPGVVERLGRHGIHVRAFSPQPRWLRFGLPATDAAFNRLKAGL